MKYLTKLECTLVGFLQPLLSQRCCSRGLRTLKALRAELNFSSITIGRVLKELNEIGTFNVNDPVILSETHFQYTNSCFTWCPGDALSRRAEHSITPHTTFLCCNSMPAGLPGGKMDCISLLGLISCQLCWRREKLIK